MFLVFGKNGQVASQVSKFPEVKCLDRAEIELENSEKCRLVILKYRPFAVINAAAYTDVDKAEIESELVNKVNAYAPNFMAMACKELDIPFIHISSEYVFDGRSGRPNRTDDKTNPINRYGLSKLIAEKLVMETYDKTIILRTSWIFSSFGRNFVRKMLDLSEKKSEISVVSDQIGGPTSAFSIAQTIILIVRALLNQNEYSGAFGLYHYSGWPDVSWADFSREIFVQKNSSTKVLDILSKDYPAKARRPLNSRLECSKILSDFQIERPNWKKDLAQMLNEM